MRIVFQRRPLRRNGFGILFGSIAVLVLITCRFLPVLSLAPGCVFRGLTGVPCPTCGATRALVRLAQGDISAALALNPLVTLSFCAAVIWLLFSIFARLFCLPVVSADFSVRERAFIRALGIVLIALNWIYLVFRLP